MQVCVSLASPPLQSTKKKRWMGEAENVKVEDGSLEEVFKGPGMTPTPKRNCWDIAQLSIPRWMALLFLFLPLPRVCAHVCARTCACICARVHTRVLVMVHTWTSENNVQESSLLPPHDGSSLSIFFYAAHSRIVVPRTSGTSNTPDCFTWVLRWKIDCLASCSKHVYSLSCLSSPMMHYF